MEFDFPNGEYPVVVRNCVDVSAEVYGGQRRIVLAAWILNVKAPI